MEEVKERPTIQSKPPHLFILSIHSIQNQHPFKWAYSTAFVIPKLARA